MNRKVFTIILMALLTLFLGVSGVAGQEPGEKTELGRSVSDAAVVNSYISYQGKLTEDGSPVTGARDMTFRLYSDNACSTQLGGSIAMPGVTVTEGLFSVKLAVNQSLFNGQGLWLGVDVGDTGTNIVCEEILPAPYALSLRPGAIISDTNSYVELNRYVMDGVSNQYGVYAESGGAIVNYGVYGKSDSGQGVHGSSDSGWGVAGVSSGNVGVHGSSDSSYGVFAISDSGVGLRAVSTGDTAVEAEASGGFAAVDARNTSGYGVYGRSDSSRGVYGRSETGYGVYGRSNSSSGAGVYAQGTGFGPDIILDGDSTSDDGRIYSDPSYASSDIILVSNDAIRIDLDNDGDSEDADFEIYDKDDNLIFNVDDGGTTRVNVLQIAGGSDLAEPFEIAGAEPVVPGMVVAIDPEHVGQLRVADEAYDRTVAGCVSGANGINPGLTMQQEGTVAEGSLPVALSGRVYCWADASAGPIQPGDLLTTSDTPGHAMKVTDYERAQGAILGKAMSPLNEGTGLVLVLVTLQ